MGGRGEGGTAWSMCRMLPAIDTAENTERGQEPLGRWSLRDLCAGESCAQHNSMATGAHDPPQVCPATAAHLQLALLTIKGQSVCYC